MFIFIILWFIFIFPLLHLNKVNLEYDTVVIFMKFIFDVNQ